MLKEFREAQQETMKAIEKQRKLSPTTEMQVRCSFWDKRKHLS